MVLKIHESGKFRITVIGSGEILEVTNVKESHGHGWLRYKYRYHSIDREELSKPISLGIIHMSYNPHLTLLITLIQNNENRAIPRTKNVPLNPTMAIISPPKKSPTTFARFRIILRGAAEALESISVSFLFSAYIWLYESENSHCANGMAAAYPILFPIPKRRTMKNPSLNPKRNMDIHERSTPENMTKKVPIFFERPMSGI